MAPRAGRLDALARPVPLAASDAQGRALRFLDSPVREAFRTLPRVGAHDPAASRGGLMRAARLRISGAGGETPGYHNCES